MGIQSTERAKVEGAGQAGLKAVKAKDEHDGQTSGQQDDRGDVGEETFKQTQEQIQGDRRANEWVVTGSCTAAASPLRVRAPWYPVRHCPERNDPLIRTRSAFKG